MKIGVIGLGMVGKEILLNLFRNTIAEHLYILDLNEDKCNAEIMDLKDSLPFALHNSYNRISFTQSYGDLTKCDIVIINVSIPHKGGMASRLDALKDNALLLSRIGAEFKNAQPNLKVVITSNPVDLMAQVFIKASGIAANRVIGSGTYLDSARLEVYLSEYYNISLKNIEGFVLGEHGDSSIIAWSLTKIAGLSMEEYSSLTGTKPVDKAKTLEYVRRRGLDIFKSRGYTDHGIGAAVYNIIAAIISDEKRILPVSVMTTGEYGLNNIVIGLPCIIGHNGIEKVLEMPLTPEEKKDLFLSADVLQNALTSIESI